MSVHKNKEERVFNIEFRADQAGENSRRVIGYAAKFNTRSEDMGFYEVIAPGAFDGVMNDDVRCLIDHKPTLILARTASGTLKIDQDAVGLRYEFDVPDTTYGNDFLVSLTRGDINQSSFAFSVKEDRWESVKDGDKTIWTRTVTEVERLFDVSPVTYPAYPDTTVSKRNMPIDEQKQEPYNDINDRQREAYVRALAVNFQ